MNRNEIKELSETVEQHPLGLSIVLHLFPGAVILAVYLLLVRPLATLGLPPLLALLGGATIGVGALQLGHLLVLGRRRNGRLSLRGVVLYTERAPIWQYVVIPLGLVVAAFMVLALTAPAEQWILRHWLAWLPPWFNFGDRAQYAAYSRGVLILTLLVRMLVDGLLIPTIEELYFRGYLMPRISRFRGWTPVLHHGLFTVYHFWQPFNYLTIFLGVLPMTWVAWKRRNIRFAIVTHLLLNLIGGLGAFGLLLSQP